MESPKQVLLKINALLEAARERAEAADWEAARADIEAALKLDAHHSATYDAMADLLSAKGEADKSAQWRENGRLVRKQAWQRQVEAEARGHHDMLGEPSRHEIP